LVRPAVTDPPDEVYADADHPSVRPSPFSRAAIMDGIWQRVLASFSDGCRGAKSARSGLKYFSLWVQKYAESVMEEAGRLWPQFTGLRRLMFQVMYGAGLRRRECRRLRIKGVCPDEGHVV